MSAAAPIAPRRIRSKILTSSIGGLLFTSVISTLAIQGITRSSIERHTIELAQGELEYLADYAVEPILASDRIALEELVQRAVRGRPQHLYAFVLAPSRAILASTFVGGIPRDIFDANPLPPPAPFSVRVLRTERGKVLDVARGVLGGQAGELHLGVLASAIPDVPEKAVTTLLVVQGGSLALAVLASFILADIIVRPLHRLLSAVQRVAGGDLSVRVGSEARDEVGRLARAFDAMVEELCRTHGTLEEMAAHAQAIVASFPSALVVTDPEGRIGFVNPGLRALSGFEPRDILARPLGDLFVASPGQSGVPDLLASLRRDGTTSSYALSLKVREGQPLPVAFNSASMVDALGRFHGFVVEVSDLARLRRSIEGLVQKRALLEEQNAESSTRPPAPSPEDAAATEAYLVRSDRLVSLGQLAATVAHEINNPLFAMMTCAKVLERDLASSKADDGARMLGTVRTILSEVERCTKILRGLLDYARVAVPRKERVALSTALDEVRALVEPLGKAQKVEIALDLAGPDAVKGDPQQLHQVLLNLAMNSVQAMPTGGKLTLGTRPGPRPGTVEVVVADTGHGIPPDVLPRVFEPFFTTKEKGKGTGLGLSVAKGIVSRHGGSIAIDTAVGSGTKVRVTLPTDEEKSP